jgi:glycosyltransferase involved in cell wall biosynthesis
MERLILTSNAYFPSIGGIENSLRHLAQEALALGYEPIMVVGDIGVKPPLKKVQEECVDGIKVIRYPLGPFTSPFLRCFNLFFSCFLCWRIYRRLHADDANSIVIARFHFNALLAAWAGFRRVKYLVPSVVKFQSGIEMKEQKRYVRWLGGLKITMHNYVQRFALKRCENFVFSETMRNQCVTLANNTSEDYCLVKPGVDGERFFPVGEDQKKALRGTLGLEANARILLFVGRFVKAKGVDLVLKALHSINDESLQLILVGDGSEREYYMALIEQLELKDRVLILPPTSNVEMYYQLADAFVMSSCYEPLGQTLLEAFASGLPVVAFRRSDMVDTATEELMMDEYVGYVDGYSYFELSVEFARTKPMDFIVRSNIHVAATNLFCWTKLLKNLLIK